MTTTLTRPAFETFEQRCQALRLLTWWCDGDGALVGEPNLLASLQPWLDSPTLRHRIETAARRLLERSDVEDVDPIFPGCTLILNAARRAADATGVVATMVLSPQFGSTREFEQLCRDGNLDAANT